MNRREIIGALAITPFASLKLHGESPLQAQGIDAAIPYETLDRMPDSLDVVQAAKEVVTLIRQSHEQDGTASLYGARMRMLSKSMSIINNGDTMSLDPEHDGKLSVSGRINAVVRHLRKRGLDYRKNIRVLTHVMGFFSEGFREGVEMDLADIVTKSNFPC